MIDAAFPGGFGTLEVPRALWQALRRFTAWVEPALIAEWILLMRGYAAGPNRILNEGVLAAMTWSKPLRGVALPRERALQLIAAGSGLHCTGAAGGWMPPPSTSTIACPGRRGPRGDLWNLLPAHRVVNQREKRDRVPADGRLRAASAAIWAWWHDA